MLENVTLAARRPLDEMPELAKATKQVEKALGAEGSVLVRWSGTEPKLRVMLKGPDEDKIRAWAKDLIEAARRDASV